MNWKRAIAREWLLFLLVFILSPIIVAVYHWTRTPSTAEDFLHETPRIYDLVILAPGYDSQFRVDSSLPKVERDQAILKFVADHPLKFSNYTLDLINPRTGDPYQIQSRSVLTAADLELIKKDLAANFWGDKPMVPMPIYGIISSPKDGLDQIDQFLQGDYLKDDSRKMLQGIRAWGFLTLKKRSLLGYVAAVVVSSDQYLAFIVIYPLFLLLRSIVWSIRKIAFDQTRV